MRAHHREGPPDARWPPVKDGGGGPNDRPRSTGDRSPRGRIAGVDAGRYLFGGTQSVNDSSPNRNVAQFPETDCSRYCLFGPNVSPDRRVVDRAVDLDLSPARPRWP